MANFFVELSNEELHTVIATLTTEYRRCASERDDCLALGAKLEAQGDDGKAQEMLECAEHWESHMARVDAVIPKLPEWVGATWPTLCADHRAAEKVGV